MNRPPVAPAAVHRAIWSIALPSMLTNVATALFGLADMWVIGRLGDAAAQGGVEVGARLMMSLLIVFNFLRSGTVALTAQASGRSDEAGQAAALARGLAVALGIGLLLLAAQPFLLDLGLDMLGATGRVRELAGSYVQVRYLGGGAWLLNAVLTGWLIGRRRMREILVVEVGANLFHIGLDLAFVLGLHMGVIGVGIATLTSETAKLVALGVVAARERPARALWPIARERATWRAGELGALFRLNRDLFARTFLLTGAMVLLTRTGAQQGATILAANAIILQIFMLAALVLDGFESAAQVLSGESVGARDGGKLDATLRATMLWGFVSAAAISGIYLAAGPWLAATFSTDPAVVETTRRYFGWAVVLPTVGIASFIFDGVFIGASWTRALMLSMLASLAVFVFLLLASRPLGNHGLWLTYTLFFVARAGWQAWFLPKLRRGSFAASPSLAEAANR